MRKFLDELSKVQVGTGAAFERCLCHKLVSLAACRRMYSGTKNYTEILCPDCRKNTHDYARIVCLGCRRLTAFLPPQRHKCGFVFERGKHYHIRQCCFCTPAPVTLSAVNTAMACPVVELEAFAKEQNFRTAADQNIVRHAERISLPNDGEFARLVRGFGRPST